MGANSSSPEPHRCGEFHRTETSGPPAKSSHLFIELEELHGQRWEERGRWNHALEEDIVAEDGREKWSRPHLPTLSVPALVRLRHALGSENVRACLAANE